MGYSKEIYVKALSIKTDSVKKAQQIYEEGLQRLRATDEEFRTIEIALAKAGSAITLAAFSGDEDKLAELKIICDGLNEKKQGILSRAGIKKPTVACRLCEDTGYAKGKLCQCVLDIAKKLTYDRLSKTLPLDNCRFDNFDVNYYSDKAMADGSVPRKRAISTLNLCKQFVENFSPDTRSLLFMGGAGLGKTHLSLALVAEVSAKGYSVVYGSAQNLFAAAEKEHFSFSGETAAQDALLNCDLLVIDDLGTEFYSSFAASLFYNVINSRLLNRKPTVINTNLTFDELEKKYSARITSRFIGGYDMKLFIGTDIRQIKAMEGK